MNRGAVQLMCVSDRNVVATSCKITHFLHIQCSIATSVMGNIVLYSMKEGLVRRQTIGLMWIIVIATLHSLLAKWCRLSNTSGQWRCDVASGTSVEGGGGGGGVGASGYYGEKRHNSLYCLSPWLGYICLSSWCIRDFLSVKRGLMKTRTTLPQPQSSRQVKYFNCWLLTRTDSHHHWPSVDRLAPQHPWSCSPTRQLWSPTGTSRPEWDFSFGFRPKTKSLLWRWSHFHVQLLEQSLLVKSTHWV